MGGPFKLLVYAVAAMAIIALFFTYILPLFFQSGNPTAVLNNNLSVAETTLGKSVTGAILFDEMSFSGATFDADNRSVAFECNSAAICCNLRERGEECTQKIEWDERRIKIKEPMEIETTVRCSYEHTLFVCKIYFGKKPAQIVIADASIKEMVDLDEEKAELSLTVENSGAIPVFFGSIKAEVYERHLEDGQWKRRYIGDALVEEQFEGIEPGGRLEKETQISVPYPGKYDVELMVKGDNAGFESRELSFEAVGGNRCMAERCDSPTLEFGKCKTRCHCVNCLLSRKCEEDVKNAIKHIPVDGEYKEVDLSDKQITHLGSNLVEVLLPAEFCP